VELALREPQALAPVVAKAREAEPVPRPGRDQATGDARELAPQRTAVGRELGELALRVVGAEPVVGPGVASRLDGHVRLELQARAPGTGIQSQHRPGA
jgi:hypothetical protein